MKTRFTSVDIQSAVAEIGASEAIGLRVANIYDIDNKTYLIRVVHGDVKKVILVESGSRIHLSEYDWPKNSLPSGFSMKCRKHLKGRRLSGVVQLGVDRIVDMTFGYNEAAYHLIVELYDRGNILLTDHEYTILQLLRVRADTDKDVKYAVREIYPIEHARQHEPMLPLETLTTSLSNLVKPNEPLKRVLNPLFVFGPAVIEHCLLLEGLQPNAKVPQQFDPADVELMGKLMQALQRCEVMMKDAQEGNVKGFIVQKKETQVVAVGGGEGEKSELLTYNEFHPFLYEQHKTLPYMELPSFNQSVDEFFSKLESQKIDMKALQVEKAALKRLENVRQDHEKRLDSLKHSQDADMAVAELIEINLQQVERALATINSAIANQYDWEEIQEIVDEAKESSDPVARMIKSLNLGSNQITMTLQNPYETQDSDSDSDSEDEKGRKKRKRSRDKGKDAVIDLNLTAFANARKYHDKRRNAAQKEQKTLEASKKALKSAEQKAQETMKEAHTSKMISKTRKTNWFEKFFWFISSENYLVVGGRDQQQNELIVKRYLKPGDLYVHADLHGASSVILKNPTGGEVPPKTLNEAGTMAICYSAAWDARVVTSAWWVHHNQVSKTAPSGEYLTTGSFMIRGKKNYLPPSYLVMGFAVIFKMDETCIANHANDRRVKNLDESAQEASMEESANANDGEEEQEIELDDGEEGEEDETPHEDCSGTALKKEGGSNECLENGNGHLGGSLKDHLKLEDDGVNGELEVEEELVAGEEEEEEEDGFAFPDTNIELKHVDGESFQLHRGMSSTMTNKYSYNDDEGNANEDEDFVYLGDGEKVSMKRQEPEARKPRLSAKQRRELKKKNKAKLMEDDMVEEAGEDDDGTQVDDQQNGEVIKENGDAQLHNQQQQQNKPIKQQQQQRQEQQQQQQQPKRRQKSKQKKMKEKYKDQDEEDKQLMQQLLRSHEPERPPKKKGKQKQLEKQQQQRQQQQQSARNKQNNQQAKTLSDVVILHQPDGEPLPEGEEAKPPADADDDDVEDPEESKESVSVMDSLTGCPRDDDILLYAVPFCAPYSCLNNFKFKVKLTPGTGRRGKAAKTALHMFQSAKETSDWEKELIKCLKDVDISRNIPGKVKVSAPNLQKAKKK